MSPTRIAFSLLLTAAALAAAWLILSSFTLRTMPAPFPTPPSRHDAMAVTAVPAPADGALRLLVPSIGVDAPVELLAVPQDGSALPAPDGPSDVGWYPSLGGTQGRHGLLVGHVGWQDGSSAVFERLGELKPGDLVALAGGTGQHRYRVVLVRDVDAFTTSVDDVLGHGPEDTVTLITCSGDYLWDAGMYSMRRVVLAVRDQP